MAGGQSVVFGTVNLFATHVSQYQARYKLSLRWRRLMTRLTFISLPIDISRKLCRIKENILTALYA